jgi:modification methylase
MGERSAHRCKDVERKSEPMIADRLLVGRAGKVLSKFDASCIDLTVTSPPYWTAVDEGMWSSYEEYLDDMQSVWAQVARVLRPGGLLCLNTALMPIPQPKQGRLPVREVKPLPFDFDHRIRNGTDLQFMDMVIWQKQTSKQMLGAYPYAGNNLIFNTCELVIVYRKPGKSTKIPKEVKEASCRHNPIRCPAAIQEHNDLCQQCWFIMPTKINRKPGDHPSPFPEKLVARFLALYTFIGSVVLDPFSGSGTTCAVAKKMRRHYVGIDINPQYVELAQARVDAAKPGDAIELRVGRPKWTVDDVATTVARPLDKAAAQRKYKSQSYGSKQSRVA